MDEPDLDIPAYASQRLRSQRIDPATKRIALAAALLAVAVIAVALVWSGVKPGFGPPPVIKPPPGPMRTVPENAGGLQVPGANEQIMSGAQSTGPPALAPSAQAPDLSRLQQDVERDQTVKHPVHSPAAAPAQLRGTESSPALPEPAGTAVPLPPPAPLAVPPPPPPAAATTAPVHGTEVQLAALDSAKAASQAWETLSARMPDLLAGHSPVVQPAVVKGRKFWRLRIAGFAGASAAKAFCARVKAEGAACEIAGF